VKAATLAVLMSALSLVGVGLVFVKLERLDERLGPLTERSSSARGRDPSVASAASGSDRGGWENEPARGSDGAARRGSEATAGVGGDRRQAEPTLIELSNQVAQIKKEQERLQKRPAPFRFGSRKFAGSVKQLSSILKLSKTQQARVESAVENAKRRVEDILKIPDESGTSPHERRQEFRRKMKEASKSGNWKEITQLAMQAHDYRQKKIPGRNSTYGEEIGRVKKDARDEIASSLSEEQKKTFEDTRIDPMLGAGGSVQMAFTTTAGDGPGGIMIERGDIVIDHPTENPADGEKEEEE